MGPKRKLLWVGDLPVPANVRQAAGGHWDLAEFRPELPLAAQLNATDAAVACPNGHANDPGRLAELLNDLNASSAMSVLLLPADAQEAWRASEDRPGKFVCAREDASPEELTAKLSAVSALRGVISRLESDLAEARDMAAGAARTMEELDEEMRLAAKLQHDFLPNRLPEVGGIRFGALFRPAGWVSGDIYDVIRLDETHVGLYVVDAVGHGMPAALLTMFIKKSLQTKRIIGNTYQIVPPHVATSELNEDICDQDLSSCQFCTAVYCVVDTDNLTLDYCRAGHPLPLLIRASGDVEELPGPGSLLGVFREEKYHTQTARLEPGDRMVLYTDGAEDALCGIGQPTRPKLGDIIMPWTRMPREELFLRLTAAIDERSNDCPPRDDITIVVMDVLE